VLGVAILTAVVVGAAAWFVMVTYRVGPDAGFGWIAALVVSGLCAVLALLVLLDFIAQFFGHRVRILPSFAEYDLSHDPLMTLLPAIPAYLLGLGILIGYTI